MSTTTASTRTDRLVTAHERLLEAVTSLTSGKDWQKMLDVARKFHSYSPNNLLLIFSQSPEATQVAGYRRWQSLGRNVRTGEHGIKILAPCIVKSKADPSSTPTHQVADADRKDGGTPDATDRVLRGFQVVHVFDIAQTDGKALPEIVPSALTGDVPGLLWDRLATHLETSGFRLLRGDTGSANATTQFLTRTVVVREGLSPAQAVKSLAHEVAHTMLHDGSEYARGCRDVTEVEAESVAYLVCGAAGVATDEYSFPYVARWAEGNVELVRKTAERVVGCARELIAALGLDVELVTEEVDSP